MEKILSVKDLCVSLTKNTQSSILKNIDMEILKGEAFGIMGETGSGKTMINTSKHKNKGQSGWHKHYRGRTAQLEREYEFEREKK